MPTFKILALLLHYPDPAVRKHGGELIEALGRDGLLDEAERADLALFVTRLCAADLLDAQAAWVETFDHSRARSLYLFEHVHGESRDRGTAMVELVQVYRDAGFAMTVHELPDYLPLFLEFLSALAPDQALAWLADTGHLIQALQARLAADASAYAVLLEPLVRLAGLDPDDIGLRARIAAEPPDDTAQALDRAWAEAPVTFGPAGGCSGRPARPDEAREYTLTRAAAHPSPLKGEGLSSAHTSLLEGEGLSSTLPPVGEGLGEMGDGNPLPGRRTGMTPTAAERRQT